MSKWAFTKGLHDLGNGCWAWLQPDGSWGYSNAGLIVDGKDSLLVDTVRRLQAPALFAPPVLVCNQEHRFIVAEQLRHAELARRAIVLEPGEGRSIGGAGTVHHVAWASPIADHEAWREKVVAAGARAILPSIHGMPYKLLPNEIARLEDAPLDPRAYVSVISHMFGGCSMGKDPATSVCDARGKVHGHEGLYVADASAIPSSLGVNPQHTIMALSRMWAQQMLA